MKFLKSAMGVSAAALALAAGSGIVGAPSASAVEMYKQDGTKIDFTVEMGFGIFHDDFDFTAANRKSVSWQEGYAIAGFKFEHAFDANWTVFGNVTGVVNGDRGQGDAIGASTGTESGGQLQDASGGVKWTDGTEGGASVNVSGGRQKWVLGDGFLIAGDQPTGGRGFGEQYNEDGGYYMNPRRVFGQTAIANIETGTPWRGDVFYIESEKGYNGQRSIAGANVDYVDKTYGSIGLTYIRGLNMEKPQIVLAPASPSAEDMNVYSVHGNLSFGIKDFGLAFTYVNEQGSTSPVNNQDLDAWAWYISPSYTFSSATWTPTIYYRFASFSGDNPNTAGTNEGYDPLFYGATGYNTWFIGEIAANYAGPFSQNADVHSIGLKTAPNIDIGIGKWTGLSGYLNHYSLREPSSFTGFTLNGGPATSHDFGTELAVYAEFQLFDNLYLSPLYSVMFTGDGFKSAYGTTDDTVQNFQLLGILTY